MKLNKLKILSNMEVNLSIADKNATLVINSVSDKIEIELTKETINNLLHLLTVASLETGEQYVQA